LRHSLFRGHDSERFPEISYFKAFGIIYKDEGMDCGSGFCLHPDLAGCQIKRNTGSYLFEIHFAEHSRHSVDYSGFNFGTALDNNADMAAFDDYFYMVNQRRDIVSVCLAGL
jgi:hypothetical protein